MPNYVTSKNCRKQNNILYLLFGKGKIAKIFENKNIAFRNIKIRLFVISSYTFIKKISVQIGKRFVKYKLMLWIKISQHIINLVSH